MDVFIPSMGQVTLPPKASGRGGSGTVYRVGELAVKILHPHCLNAEQAVRVRALTRLPDDPRFAIPREEVFDRKGGTAIGFWMKWVAGVPLLCLLDKTAAAKHGVAFTTIERLVAALRLAELYAAAHRQLRMIVGDGNESNFLVALDPKQTITVRAIDIDEFGASFRDPVSGRFVEFHPTRGKEPYLAPQLQGVDLSKVRRTEDDDAFSLAALLFHLVLGSQSFAVVAPPNSPPPGPVGGRIKNGLWPYAPRQPLPAGWAPAGARVWAALPKEIKDLFHACFHNGHTDPSARPRPEDWVTALTKWIQAEQARPQFTAAGGMSPPRGAAATALPRNLAALARLIVQGIFSLAPARAAAWLGSRLGFLRSLFGGQGNVPQPPPPMASRPKARGRYAWLRAFVCTVFVLGVLATFAVTRFGFTLSTSPPPPTTPPPPSAPSPRRSDDPRWQDAPRLWRELLDEGSTGNHP